MRLIRDPTGTLLEDHWPIIGIVVAHRLFISQVGLPLLVT